MTDIFNTLNFVNHYLTLPDSFYSPVEPDPVRDAKVISTNKDAAKLLGLNQEQLSTDSFTQLMAGQSLPESASPIATVYAGHQFGGYSAQLGDGRALLIGQIHNDEHGLWELQIKGAGRTPYSRFGDGRAVLRSTIREYLCSEAMHGLDIPTTRALAICTSSTPVEREKMETAATLLRMAPSHIRFGHFEFFFYTKQHDQLKTLADFVIQHHYPELASYPDSERYIHWLNDIVKRTAHMIAKWQAYGFAHGVMNTDNMSILGLTLDYGPYAFLDDFDPTLICNHSDHSGRYAFNQQVQIGLWNLNALAHSLSPLIPVEALRDALTQYEPQLLSHYRDLMRQRFGLQTLQDDDDSLMSDFLSLLQREKADFHLSFRRLSTYQSKDAAAFADHFIDREAIRTWLDRYEHRLDQENSDMEQRHQKMLACNPKYVLRNYLAQQAIEAAEQEDYGLLNDLLNVLQTPFAEHTGYEHLAEPPPEWGKQLEISCSS